MEKYLVIFSVAAMTYASRFGGFILGSRNVPRIVDRFLVYVPVAVFAALIAPDLGLGTHALPARLIGVAAATLVVLRVRQLWAGLAAGMAAYWIVRAFGLG